jgi:parvulin-like peptidyl-prolyl isomerase
LPSLTQEQVILYGQQVMERLISRKVVKAIAGPALLEEARQEAARAIQEEAQGAETLEAFRASLAERGMTPDQYEDLVRFQIILQRLAEKEGIVPQEASVAETRSFYKKNQQRLAQTGQLEAGPGDYCTPKRHDHRRGIFLCLGKTAPVDCRFRS